MSPLSSKRRSELRAEAHRLTPVVIIGDKGLTDEVITEIDRSLKAHELIKVRAATNERDARDIWLETICGKLAAHPVQQIGKVFVLYRENPKEEKPKRKLGPGPSPHSGARGDEERKPRGNARGDEARKPRSGARGDQRRSGARDDVKRTSRPRSRTPSPRPESAPPKRRPRTSR